MKQDLELVFPADLEKAQKHRLATRIFKGDVSIGQSCSCCGRRIGQQGASPNVCYSPVDDLLYLGPGAQLLFVFTQNASATLLLFTGIFAVFALVTNLLGNSCKLSGKCAISFLNRISIANKIDDEISLVAQSFLISAYLILYAVAAQFLIWRIRSKSKESDNLFQTPSDYSIIIKKCPPGVNEEQITHMIQTHRRMLNYQQKQSTDNLAIARIIVSYSLKQYLSLKAKRQKQFLKAKKKDPDCQFVVQPIAKPTVPAGLAIVVFQRAASKQMFWDNQKEGCASLFVDWCDDVGSFQIGGSFVQIQRAPEPDDIIWQNADLSEGESRKRKVISYILGGMILGIGGLLQYYLQYFQVRIEDQPTQAWFSYVSSALVTIFNTVIVQFLIATTSWQGELTRTGHNQSLMIKISIYSFFNTGIFYTLASILAQREGQFDIQGDVSFEISLFMALNGITPHLTSLILNKIEFPNIIIRYLLSRDYFKYSQHDANEVFELPSANFSVQYAYVVKTVWLTCFYAPFVPVVVPISILGLTVFYFTQGELFRTKYRVPTLLSASITMAATRLMDFTGIIMSSGQLIIIIYLKAQFNEAFSLDERAAIGLGMTLGGLLVLMPSIKINRQLFNIDSEQQQNQTYERAKQSFQVTYEGTNPASETKELKRKSDLHLLTALRFRQNSSKSDAMRELSDFTQRTPLKSQHHFEGESSVK